MLLAIDIGNSNISVGLFDEKRDLKFLSSIDTDSRKTADQISIDLMNIFSLYRYDLRDVSIQGGQYPLHHAVLTAEFPLGVSNHFVGRPITVSVRDGSLLIGIVDE